jgi:hypothetical protein
VRHRFNHGDRIEAYPDDGEVNVGYGDTVVAGLRVIPIHNLRDHMSIINLVDILTNIL